MRHRWRLRAALALAAAAAGTWPATPAGAQSQGASRPRPGLTAQQTREAIGLATESLRELRKKVEGAARPDADPREYIVGVELLAGKEPATPATEKANASPTARHGGPKAVVTSYRYLDDTTVIATVDLGTGRVVKSEALQHLRTPLSDAEFEEAKMLAREKSEEVQKLYGRFGDQISVYPQFSQYRVKDDPRVHRVVHLAYRVGTQDLSYPRPMVDLTTRRVETPVPAAEPRPRARR